MPSSEQLRKAGRARQEVVIRLKKGELLTATDVAAIGEKHGVIGANFATAVRIQSGRFRQDYGVSIEIDEHNGVPIFYSKTNAVGLESIKQAIDDADKVSFQTNRRKKSRLYSRIHSERKALG